MVKLECIEKQRDNNGNIKMYKMSRDNGELIYLVPDELKRMIREGQVQVVNLKLTLNDKLIDIKRSTNHGVASEVFRRSNLYNSSMKTNIFKDGVKIQGEYFGCDVEIRPEYRVRTSDCYRDVTDIRVCFNGEHIGRIFVLDTNIESFNFAAKCVPNLIYQYGRTGKSLGIRIEQGRQVFEGKWQFGE